MIGDEYHLSYHLDSRYSNLHYKATLALAELQEFWTEVYGPNESLTVVFETLEAMDETWEGQEVTA